MGERLASDRGADMEGAAARAQGWASGCACSAIARICAALMAAADIFVLPSQFEGLPMSVIEAMLSGLARRRLATFAGRSEQVVEGETGLLVPMGDAGALRDAIARLAADPDLRRRMGEAGRDRAVELFDETKTVAHALDALGL